MNALTRFFRRRPVLDQSSAERLAGWQRLPAPAGTTLAESRLVVVDVETSGLNLASDRLIAIGAVAVNGGRIDLGDSFEIILQQPTVSERDNILIHGIGGTAQREGVPPAEALLRFLEYLGKDPLVAFHVTFDETMIRRALDRFLGLDFRHPWLDLAYVMPALYPALAPKYRALDEWAGHFGIRNYARHSALADALCTAQLFLVAVEQAKRGGALEFKSLQALEKAQRWISWAS
jgi:DNA polymerase-3 subunit epsilon